MDKRKDFTLCVLNTNSPYFILGCVGSVVRLLLDGKRICFLLRSVIYISPEFFAVLHVSLCYREKITDLKDMFNSRYI